MILFSLQAVLLIAAGVGLFRLWRASAPIERWLALVVAAGFLSRAFLGQLLFWISWANLPIARGLQMGNGIWFFALDALLYLPSAMSAARDGLWAIITINRGSASVMYVQVLALAVWLLGHAASVAVLLNLYCYLGMMAILVRWRAKEPRTRAAAALAIVAISLSPAFVLWSLQPLKDTFFQFLFVAFVATCAAWQRAWVAPGGRLTTRIAVAAALCILLFAIAAVRWYFAFALLIAASLFLILDAFKSAGRKLPALAAALGVIVLLSRALIAGSGPYLPEVLRPALTPWKRTAAVATLPGALVSQVDQVRSGFDRAGGQTSIRPGNGTQTKDRVPLPPAIAPRSTPAIAPKPMPVATQTSTATRPPTRPPQKRVSPPVAPEGSVALMTARTARLASGAAVVVLPRSLGERLGIFHIGGGRGLLWFADIDTVVFDLVLVCALLALFTRASVSLRNPMAWLAAGITLLIGGPLIYSITNFGTLFRLREMIYLGLLLTPLAVASTAEDVSETRGNASPEAASPRADPLPSS